MYLQSSQMYLRSEYRENKSSYTPLQKYIVTIADKKLVWQGKITYC